MKLLKEAGKICVCKRNGFNELTDALIKEGRLLATNGLLDLTVDISELIEDEYEKETFLFPAERIANVFKLLPDDSKIEWGTKGNKVFLKCEKTDTQITWMQKIHESYPMSEKGKAVKCGSVQAKDLLGMIQYVENAQARKSPKISMTGQLWEFEAGKMKVTATDGFRLAQAWAAVECPGKNGRCVVPGANISSIAERLESSDGAVEILIGNGQVIIRQEKWELVSRLIDENFVNYKGGIPSLENGTEIAVNREGLLICLKIDDVATGSEIVNLRTTDRSNLLEITATSRETGQYSRAVITLEGLGWHMREPIMMNLKFISDALKSGDSEKVKIRITRNEKSDYDLVMLCEEDSGWFYLLAQTRATDS